MGRFFGLSIAAGLLLAAAAAADEEGKGDKDSLEGTWSLVSVEINKQPLAMEKLKEARLVVKGKDYSFKLGDMRLELTHKMYPDRKPKAMDMTVTEGPDKGKTLHAIYKLEGDTLTICRHTLLDKPRPTEFATKPDSGLMLIVWKRIKP
ncbi:MAG TPA: TIGR03067 domain-containing protein [Gemmataceae bacterium]|nr:TIGR03067 domain-containing protein [Gemmataceae bacterium]